jgi:UDP-glucuronate 4-epimerase
VPFSVHDEINLPSSIYAATKNADEDIARVYHHLYKIPITGLRFFTVWAS